MLAPVASEIVLWMPISKPRMRKRNLTRSDYDPQTEKRLGDVCSEFVCFLQTSTFRLLVEWTLDTAIQQHARSRPGPHPGRKATALLPPLQQHRRPKKQPYPVSTEHLF